MRQFVRRLIIAGLLFGALLPARGDNEEALFQNVSRDYWAYCALDRAERAGLATGFPEGSFRGRQVLTRYELAQAVERVLREVYRGLSGVACGSNENFLRGAAVKKVFLDRKPSVADLSRLAAEFAPDLKLLGAYFEGLDRTLHELERPQAPRSRDPLLLEKSGDYRRGAQRAREDWDQGAVALFNHHYPLDSRIDSDLGLPYHRVNPADDGTDASHEYVAGHNEEIYHLILQRGLPRNSRLPWIKQIRDPSRAWDEGKRAQVEESSPTATVPGSTWTVHLLPAQRLASSQLEVRTADGRSFQVSLHEWERRLGKVELLRGAAASPLLFVRWRLSDSPVRRRYLVVDTALQQVLNEEDQPDPPTWLESTPVREAPPGAP